MKIRVSIGNLAPQFTVAGRQESLFFGILNRKAFEKGRHQINPVGGAAQMTPAGKEFLESSYGAEFQEGLDARFVIERKHIDNILLLFEVRNPSIYEIDPRREIEEELSTEELPIQNEPVFTPKQVGDIQIEFIKSLRQMPGNGSTSARETEQMPTVRLFNMFRLVLPAPPALHFTKLMMSPVVRIVPNHQIRKICAGEEQKTEDGWQIGDNFIW